MRLGQKLFILRAFQEGERASSVTIAAHAADKLHFTLCLLSFHPPPSDRMCKQRLLGVSRTLFQSD